MASPCGFESHLSHHRPAVVFHCRLFFCTGCFGCAHINIPTRFAESFCAEIEAKADGKFVPVEEALKNEIELTKRFDLSGMLIRKAFYNAAKNKVKKYRLSQNLDLGLHFHNIML